MKKRKPTVKALCITCGWHGKLWNSNQNCPRSKDPAHVITFVIDPWPSALTDLVPKQAKP